MEYLLRQRPGWLRGYIWFGGHTEDRPAIGRQALVALSIRVAAAALAFGAQMVLARWLGSFEFGVFTYAAVWLNVAGSLCAAGFGASALRFLPAYQASGETAKARGYLVTGRAACLLAGAAGGIAMTGYVLLPDPGSNAAFALLLAAVSLPAYALTDFQDGIGRSQGRIASALVPPYILRPVLALGATVLLIAGGLAEGAVAAAAALAMATWFTVAVQLVWQTPQLRRTFPAEAGRSYAPKLWLSVSMPLLLVDGFALLLTNLDVLMLEFWAKPEKIGIYYAAIRTVSLIAFVQFAISAGASARISALHASGRRGELRILMKEAQIMSLVPSLICAVPLVIFGKWISGPLRRRVRSGLSGDGDRGFRLARARGSWSLTEPAYDRRPPETGGIGPGLRGSDQSGALLAAYSGHGPRGSGDGGGSRFQLRSLGLGDPCPTLSRRVYFRLIRYSAIARTSSSGSMARLACTSPMPPLESRSNPMVSPNRIAEVSSSASA